MSRRYVTLKAGEDRYQLRYSANALIALEDELGAPLPVIGERMEAGAMGLVLVAVAISMAALIGSELLARRIQHRIGA